MIHTKWMDGATVDLVDIHRIRRLVFIEEQGVPEEIEIDGTDTDALHLLIYDNNEPVATGRLIFTGTQYIIGRVATIAHKRRNGYGGLVMRMLIRRAFDMGAEEQFVHAQLRARKFYESLGFVPCGSGEYEEAGIPHIDMVHRGDIGGDC